MKASPLVSRRQFIQGTAGFGSAMLLPQRALTGQSASVAVLPEFRKAGDRDDTAALLRAAATGRQVFVPEGRYAIAMTAEDDLPDGFELIGEGAQRSIIARSYARQASFILHADSRSARVEDNLRGIRLRGVGFVDQVEQRGYSQFDYLVMLSGVSGAIIEGVSFQGFRGDGLYLGSSTVRSFERHNHSVLVSNCHFDGANANNRNAISVLDCSGLVVENCTFLNVGRNGGPSAFDAHNPLTGLQNPGAIDIEPEATGFARVEDVIIRNNHFAGGGGYAVTLNLFANGQDGLARNIAVTGNKVVDRFGGVRAVAGASVEGGVDQHILVEANEVSNCDSPFLFDGVVDLQLLRNNFTDCSGHAELGWSGGVKKAKLIGNNFLRIGSTTGYALWIRTAEELVLTENKFIDCGKPSGTLGIPLAFVSGISREVSIIGNRFANISGRTTQAITVFADAALDPASLQTRDNRLVGGIALSPAAAF